jgi:hypothetical protein
LQAWPGAQTIRAVGEGLVPDSARLRQAIEWLAAQPVRNRELLELASQRFALSPLDAAVLFRYFSAETIDLYDKDQ